MQVFNINRIIVSVVFVVFVMPIKQKIVYNFSI